jgi:hypothetical protein
VTIIEDNLFSLLTQILETHFEFFFQFQIPAVFYSFLPGLLLLG